MNFLTSLFKKRGEHVSASDTLEKIRLQMKNGESPIFDALFYMVVQPCTRISWSNGMSQSLSKSLKYVSGKDYDNDGACFELAAFLMARADRYLFLIHRESQNEIFRLLAEKFVGTFSPALNLSQTKVRKLLTERLMNYARFDDTETDSKRIFTLVSAIIHDTLENGGVPKTPVRRQPLSHVDFEDLILSKSISNINDAFSPQMKTAMNNVVTLSQRKAVGLGRFK